MAELEFGEVRFEGAEALAKLLARTDKDLAKSMRQASQEAGRGVAAKARELYDGRSEGHGFRHRPITGRSSRPTGTRNPTARFGGARFRVGTKWSKPRLGVTIKAQQSRTGIVVKAGSPAKWHAWIVHRGHAVRNWNHPRPSGSPPGDDVKANPFLRDAIKSEYGAMMRRYRRGIHQVIDEFDRRQAARGESARGRRGWLGGRDG